MAEQVIIGIGADISSFQTEMENLKSTYMSTKKEVDENKIEAPMSESDVQQSFAYMLSSVSSVERVIQSVQDITSTLPLGVQEAMGTLVSGMKSSLSNLTSFVKTAGETASRDFNQTGFNNNLRFSAASLMQYTKDLKSASEIVTQMSDATREIYSQNHREISSVVNPAISRLFTKHHMELPDRELAAELLKNDGEYAHISKLLDSYGVNDAMARRQIVEAAIKTSTQRRNRLDVQRAFADAGIKQLDKPIFATDAVRDTYKNAYINGGRYIDENATPLNTRRADRNKRHDFYEGIKQEVLNGNSVAFKAAQNAGLIELSDGNYRFVKERFAKDEMLDQFAGYVVRERKRAAQGAPQYFKALDNPYNATDLLKKDGRRLREADRLIDLDTRPNANPYLKDNYKVKPTTEYEHPLVGEFENPALSIPELINIPRMTVQSQNGRAMFKVKRFNNETGKTVYEPNINYEWKKEGILENPYDEFITMGSNPILDRLIARHASDGAKFEDRSFGYGFDAKDNPKGGLPLIINMDLNELREKDNWGKIKFYQNVTKDGKTTREAYFPKDSAELINGLYRGDIEPQLQVTSLDAQGNTKTDYVPYRAFAGKTTGGGTMMFMPSADYQGMIEEDKSRGIMPMLQYFSEMENGKDLINPATGKPFTNNETGLGAYARFYDARNKLLSHSLPIESLQGKTPTAALVNFGAYYKAVDPNEDHPEVRFDGGGFIAPDVYSKDFQARMGPAKFLAQRFNWRQWFVDAGFATKGGEHPGDNDYHFFMPGMATTADDYKAYRAAYKANLPLTAKSFSYDDNGTNKTVDFGGRTFKEWRDDLFVDIMDKRYGALLADTTIKAPGVKQGRISEEQFDQIAKVVAGNPNSAFNQKKIIDSATVGKADASPMVKLTTAQQTELMSMMSDPKYGMGLRLMKDTENYTGQKEFWSPAYMSSVMMTPAMIKRSTDNYIKAFEQMSSDEGIIRRMFSGNDADSVRVRNNPDLIHTDSNIKYKIEAEKKNLAAKQLLGYAYFPRESGMNSQMLVAAANPFSVFNPIGSDITGHEAEGAAAFLKTKKHGVIASSVNGNGLVNWTRSPYAPGANFFGSPVSKKSLARYGLTEDSALFNIADFYELNTGDFDGDFVWANTALKEDKDFQERTEKRNKKVVEIANKRIAERKALLKSKGKTDAEIDAEMLQFSSITDRAFNAASGPTGLGYKVGQAFRMGLFTEKDLAEIDDYANDTYQVGIDMAKKANLQLASPTKAVSEAIKTRKPIERLTKELQETFNGSGQIGSVDLFKYGLPTYVDTIGTGILSASKSMRAMDVGVMDFVSDQIRQNNKVRYANATKEEQDLGEWYGNLVAGKLSGAFQITSTDTLAKGRTYLNNLGNSIEALKAKGGDKETLARMMEMYNGAKQAIETESTIGFTENNLGYISDYYRRMNWENPVTNRQFDTEAQAAAAVVYYQQRRQAEQAKADEILKSDFDKVVKEQTGKNVTNENRQSLMDRINAAHMYTGFNWSNAKYFTEGSMTIPETRRVSLEGDPAKYAFKAKPDPLGLEKTEIQLVPDERLSPVTIDYNDKRAWNQAQIARQILTGSKIAEPELEAHALIGSAAHAFMDEYGKARAFKSENGEMLSPEESLVKAQNALLDYLLGTENEQGIRKRSKEQIEAQQKAGVSFSLDEYGKLQVSGTNANKIGSKVQRINEGALKDVAGLYYERALSNLGEHMIMTEGTSFGLDENGNLKQLEALGKEGHNGIFIVPQRNNENVIGFQRFRKDKETGQVTAVDAGTYFTPDMIKQNAEGAITVVDWKSSAKGQQDALLQTAYYAHNLEELGKKYYQTGNKEYEKFARFVNYDKATDTFTSNIKHLESVDLFGNKNDAVLQANYSQELGDAVAQWVEGGMQNLAKDAQLGFIKQLPQDIQVVFRKAINGNRPVLAPGADEKEHFINTKDIASLLEQDVSGSMRQLYEVAQGRTGIKDASGEYIDQDKAFLVEKYREDRAALDQVKSFSFKEKMKLYNLDYEQKDRYTQNIESLKSIFTPEDYATLQRYYEAGEFTAPDVEAMDAHFTAQQHEARQQMETLYRLRQRYFDKMPEELGIEYGRIAYGQGNALSKLRTGIKKRQQDLSVINEIEKTDPYYDEQKGYIPVSAQEIFQSIYKDPERAENESKKAYNERRNEYKAQVMRQAEEAAKGRLERVEDYATRRTVADASFGQFENDILAEINKEKENENFLYSMLKGKDLSATIFGLKDKAQQYRDLEATTLYQGEHAPHVYSDKARSVFAEESKRLADQAETLEKLRQDDRLTNLLSAQSNFDVERITALMTGGSVSQGTIKNKALADFALAYSKLNANLTPDELLKAVDTYGATYDTRAQDNIDRVKSNALFQNEMAERQRQFQYDRYDRTRYGNVGRFAQYYYQQQDRRFELETQQKNAEHGIASTQALLKTETDPQKIAQAEAALAGYKQAAAAAGAELQKFNPAQNLVAAGAKSLSDSLNMVVRRLGYQTFRKAIQEAKKFVREYQQQMTTIQMITLKSDEEMSKIGDGLIDRAKELKISVSEISQSAATLYRQGLSDEEVNERLEVISKFSKVSGTKVDAATKLITIAMNTGLVTDPQVAADVVTALGDNAATNAAQIEKGIEKAGAAAAADGTTFAELASMLTAITSTTQIGGNVAGRTLNTIFGRMNKIGTNELIYDENGNAISGSAVAKLLEAQGISQYANGKKKSSYQTLYELSQKWDNLSDAEQQQLAAAIAGTRQYSNFSAVMQGMAEGKVDEYMQLAGASSGITDKKYDIYTQSLEASLTDLKNTYDELVHDFTDNGALTGFLGFVTNMIQGIDNLGESLSGLGAILVTVLPLLTGLSLLKAGLASGNLGLAGIGLLAAGAGGLIASLSGNSIEEVNPIEQYKNKTSYQNKNMLAYTSDIARAKELKSLGVNRSEEQSVEYKSLLDKIASEVNISFDDLTDSTSEAASNVSDLADSASTLGEAAKNATPNIESYADYILGTAEEDVSNKKAREFIENADEFGAAVYTAYNNASSEWNNGIGIQNAGIFKIDPSTGEVSLRDNVHNYLTGNYSDYGSLKSLVTSAEGKTVRDSFATIMTEALRAPDYTYKVPLQYVNNDKQYWYDYANSGGPFFGPEDLPDEVLQAVVGYWNKQSRRSTRNQAEKEAFISQTTDILNGEEYSFVPQEYKEILPSLLYDSIPLNKYGEKDVSPNTIKYALWNAAGITENTDLSSIKIEDIDSNLKNYVKNKGKIPILNKNSYQLEEVDENGYYIDLNKQPGEEGYRVSREEAQRKTEEYNKSLSPVVETIEKGRIGSISIDGKVFEAYDLSNEEYAQKALDRYTSVLNRIQEIQDYLKEVSEDPNSPFQSLSVEDKNTFALNQIKKRLKEIGVNYTGDVALLLANKAEDLVKYAEEVIVEEVTTEPTEVLPKPNYKPVEDYALGGRETSYNTWSTDKKVNYSLTADRVYRILRSSGATDINTWLQYVNDNAIRDFESLYSNGEFGLLMEQVRRNSETGKYEGPTDIMDQIVRYLLANGNDYGAAFVSNKQKADYAQSMLSALVDNEDVPYISYEEALEAENRAREKYETNIRQIVEQNRAKYGDKFTEEEYLTMEKSLREINPYTHSIGAYFTKDEEKYLAEITGEELYGKLIGKNGEIASEEEKRYAQLLIDNRRYGLPAFTASQRLTGINEVRKNINRLGIDENAYSRLVADAYMSQWSDWAEYASLIEKRNNLKEGETLSFEDAERLNVLGTSLDEFQKSANISVELEGVQNLENAGKLIDGTTAKLEKLRKGGHIALEVELQMRSEAFEQAEQRAKLYNGTVTEQDRAAMDILHMSREEYYGGEGRVAHLKQARNYDQDVTQILDADTWATLFKEAPAERKQEIIRLAHTAGFYEAKEQGEFEYKGIELPNVSPLIGASRNYSDAEKNRALDQILSREIERSTGENGNSELYDAAIEAAGTYTAELLRRRANNENIDDWLRIASANERSAYQLQNLTNVSGQITSAQKAQYAINNYDVNRAGDLASYLDMNEEDIKRLMKTDKGKEQLKNSIEEKTKNLYSVLSESFDLNLNVADMSSMKNQIQEAASNTEGMVKEFLQWIADSINIDGLITGTSGFSTFDEYVNESLKGARDTRTAMEEVGDFISDGFKYRGSYDEYVAPKGYYVDEDGIVRDARGNADYEETERRESYVQQVQGRNYEGLLSNSNVDWSALDQDLAYMLHSRANGDKTFSDQMIDEAYNNALYGRKSSPENQQRILNSLFSGDMSAENMISTYQTWMQDQEKYAAELGAYNNLDGIENITEALTSQENAAEKTETALENYNKQLNAKQIGYLNKYGDYTEEVAANVENLGKNAKTSSQTIAQLRQKMSQLNNAAEAIKGSKGKTGADLTANQRADLAAVTGEDSELMREMTKEQISQIADRAKTIIDEDFTNSIGGTIAEELSRLAAEKPVEFEMAVQAHVGTDGALDLSEVGAIGAELQDAALAELAAYAGTVGELLVKVTKGEMDAKAVIELIRGSVNGSGKRSGGGSGGGGKSALDKLLEEQKRKIAALQHESKMLEIQEKGYDFVNDYTSQDENITAQIDVQERLRQAYTDNLAELQNQLKGVKEGTDDWNKLTEAIQSAEEALASVDNAINDINARRITIVEQKQTNEDKLPSHNLTMLSKYAERYQIRDNFESYAAVMEKTITETRNQISQNNKQISEWESLLYKYKEGSDDWLKVRDNIWAMREENAELENKVASDTIGLQEARISQIAKDLENEQMPLTHANTMLDTIGQIYQSTGNTERYRETLQGVTENNQQLKEANDKAIQELKKQIESMAESDPARQSAIQTLYQLEETSAQFEASILSNRQAIEESLIEEINRNYGDKGGILDHEMKLLQEAERDADRENNYAQYQNILNEEARNTAERLANNREELEKLLELQNSGQITEGSEQWRNLEERIRATKETIAALGNEFEEAVDKINTAKFEEIQERFNETYELLQHTQKLIQYEEAKYQSNGQLTNYGTALGWERDELLETRTSIEAYIESLREQQRTAENQPELYKRITSELYKWEEQLAQTNNAIEKNEQAMEKNQEAIRKARIAVEQQADKAIRERVQTEKNMLAATVSIENSILSVIRKNYQDQWDLEKKTIDKKKQALQEEKNLINERLNARKKAIDQEDKYEELAEYQHQLALISADTTRTKEQAELRKKIADLQKDIAWDVANDEANAQAKSIDDQIAAIDTYVATYQEDLTEMLSNANNFREDLDNLLNGSFEDFMAWNAQYNEDYTKKTEEERKQMEQGWHDTWRTMKDELVTYWEEVDESLRSKDGWLDLIRSTDSYLKLSDTEKESFMYQMDKLYRDYESSLIDNAEFDDQHKILETISEMRNWTFSVRDVGQEDYNSSFDISDYAYRRNRGLETPEGEKDYAGIGYVAPAKPKTTPAKSASTGKTTPKQTYYFTTTDERGNPTSQGGSVTASSYTEAMQKANAAARNMGRLVDVVYQKDNPNSPVKTSYTSAGADLTKHYATGGLVDYTGYAWVDGTKAHPESYLDAQDTELLRNMLDAFTYVKNPPTITHLDSSNFSKAGITVGDVNVNLYEAKLENDADYDTIAQKVGKAFTKQLEKDGFNLAKYAW